MSQRRISLKKIKEIIRLYKEHDLSKRKIARALNISRPVVDRYIRDFESSGLGYNEIKDMPDDVLLERLNCDKKFENARYNAFAEKFGYYVKELKRTGVTLRILWEEYINTNSGGYSYSQFCYHYQGLKNSSELAMHMEHKAGDKMFVDFTGKKLSITDRITGEQREAEIFAAILGASHLTYVEAALNQKKESWIRLNENALIYFGGVPRAIVPDCLKSAVTKSDRYEPDINPEYLDFARHCNTAILPARPAKPKDKALVEGAVNIVYSWIFAKLRNETFYSLDELNAAIREKLAEYNAKPMQKIKISRMDLFNETEKSELGKLPLERYEIRKFKRLKAQFNYHIYLSDDRHYYSIPYQHRGKYMEILYSDRVLEVYHNNIRIAFHKRNDRKNGYSTLKEHMPPNHQWQDDWSPEKLLNWSEQKGANIKSVIEAVLAMRQHPEQSYKTCLGILSLSKEHGDHRLDKACGKALYYGEYSFKWIKNILTNCLESVSEERDLFKPLPEHENIRGHQYYLQGGLDEQSSNN